MDETLYKQMKEVTEEDGQGMPAGAKVLKHFEATDDTHGLEQANKEFKEYGFQYNTQGAFYSSPMGTAVYFPKGNIAVVSAIIYDKAHWFAIEMDPREVEELQHKLKGMAAAVEDAEDQEHEIVGEWMKLAGMNDSVKESKVNERFNANRKFWLVTDPVSAESVIEDVMGTEPKTVVAIGRIIVGGGNTLGDAIRRWENEHPALYPEDSKEEALEDANKRLAAMKGKEGFGVAGVGAA